MNYFNAFILNSVFTFGIWIGFLPHLKLFASEKSACADATLVAGLSREAQKDLARHTKRFGDLKLRISQAEDAEKAWTYKSSGSRTLVSQLRHDLMRVTYQSELHGGTLQELKAKLEGLYLQVLEYQKPIVAEEFSMEFANLREQFEELKTRMAAKLAENTKDNRPTDWKSQFGALAATVKQMVGLCEMRAVNFPDLLLTMKAQLESLHAEVLESQEQAPALESEAIPR